MTTSALIGASRDFVETLNAVLAKVLRHLWTSFGAVAGAVVLLLGGGGLLIWHETQPFNDAHARTVAAQVNAETMEAYAQVSMTICGGRPCVKLDAKSPRWGDKGQYMLIDFTSKPKAAPSKIKPRVWEATEPRWQDRFSATAIPGDHAESDP